MQVPAVRIAISQQLSTTLGAAMAQVGTTPNEVAGKVAIVPFLASERASFMVGSIVMADGGMSVAIN